MELGKVFLVLAAAIKIALIVSFLANGNPIHLGGNPNSMDFSESDIKSFVGMTIWNFLYSLGIPIPIIAIIQTFIGMSVYLYLRSIGFGNLTALAGTVIMTS